jgi:hypothetical protein
MFVRELAEAIRCAIGAPADVGYRFDGARPVEPPRHTRQGHANAWIEADWNADAIRQACFPQAWIDDGVV